MKANPITSGSGGKAWQRRSPESRNPWMPAAATLCQQPNPLFGRRIP